MPEGVWRMEPGQHSSDDCEATGGAAGKCFVEKDRLRAGSGQRPAWLNQMLARVYLRWADVVLRGMSSAHTLAPSQS